MSRILVSAIVTLFTSIALAFAIATIITLVVTGCAKPKDGKDGGVGDRGPAGSMGPQGPSGLDGQDAVIEVVTPCPAVSGSYPEVLWRLVDNKLYAVYASGNKIHLTEIPPGHYQTTDGRGCLFTVNPDLSLSYP